MTAPPVTGSLLSYLLPGDREFLLGRGTPRTLPAGAALMHEGDPTDHVLVLRSGWVRVYSSTKDGQVILLALRGPGDVIGDLAALQPEWTRTGTVETLQKIAFTQFRTEEFLACLHDRPSVAIALLRQMAVRLRDAEAMRVDFATHDVAQRVAAVLVRLVDAHGQVEDGNLVLRWPLTQQDIADRIGASRRAVARALATLRERHIVTTGRHLYVVTAPDVLRLFAGTVPNGT